MCAIIINIYEGRGNEKMKHKRGNILQLPRMSKILDGILAGIISGIIVGLFHEKTPAKFAVHVVLYVIFYVPIWLIIHGIVDEFMHRKEEKESNG